MRTAAIALVVLAALGAAPAIAQPAPNCFVFHGRLQAGNGTPSVRIWRIGTHRLVGVPDGPDGDELSSIPANVRIVLRHRPEARIYGDFHVCALSPLRDGEMQFVRVESANITAVTN